MLTDLKAALVGVLHGIYPTQMGLPAQRKRVSRHAKGRDLPKAPNKLGRLQRRKRYCLKGVRP